MFQKAGEVMAQSNASLQLELIAGARARRVKAEAAGDPLLGRTFFDGSSDVRVVGLCPSNPSHMMLERRADGRRWTAPSSLMRLILPRGRKSWK
jgi:hypothetical protein